MFDNRIEAIEREKIKMILPKFLLKHTKGDSYNE